MTKRRNKTMQNKVQPIPNFESQQEKLTQMEVSSDVIVEKLTGNGYPPYPGHTLHSPQEKVVTIETKTAMNFRASPDSHGRVIDTVKKGERFTLLNRLSEWLEVKTLHAPYRVGYLKTEFTKEVSDDGS